MARCSPTTSPPRRTANPISPFSRGPVWPSRPRRSTAGKETPRPAAAARPIASAVPDGAAQQLIRAACVEARIEHWNQRERERETPRQRRQAWVWHGVAMIAHAVMLLAVASIVLATAPTAVRDDVMLAHIEPPAPIDPPHTAVAKLPDLPPAPIPDPRNDFEEPEDPMLD